MLVKQLVFLLWIFQLCFLHVPNSKKLSLGFVGRNSFHSATTRSRQIQSVYTCVKQLILRQDDDSGTDDPDDADKGQPDSEDESSDESSSEEDENHENQSEKKDEVCSDAQDSKENSIPEKPAVAEPKVSPGEPQHSSSPAMEPKTETEKGKASVLENGRSNCSEQVGPSILFYLGGWLIQYNSSVMQLRKVPQFFLVVFLRWSNFVQLHMRMVEHR